MFKLLLINHCSYVTQVVKIIIDRDVVKILSETFLYIK